MSLMCSMGQCRMKKGMCGHEKMMLGMMILIAVVGLTYWLA